MMTDENISGLVVSGYGGFYQVLRGDNNKVVDCKGRGRLKKTHSAILVGDEVTITLPEDGSGLGQIETIAPRRNTLPRPHIANIDQAVIVLACHLPDYDLLLLDNLLLNCRLSGISACVCFNKADLLSESERKQFVSISEAYGQADCPVLLMSAVTGTGLKQLQSMLRGKRSVFCGPSGVGKSSLLNLLLGKEQAEVGAVSERLLRGRHTTRYVRLLPLFGDGESGMIADSPGFFVLDTPEVVTIDLLPRLYPEYLRIYDSGDGCRFDGCRHDREPDCAVRAAVERNELDEGRYQRYLRILHEIKTREVKYK